MGHYIFCILDVSNQFIKYLPYFQSFGIAYLICNTVNFYRAERDPDVLFNIICIAINLFSLLVC